MSIRAETPREAVLGASGIYKALPDSKVKVSFLKTDSANPGQSRQRKTYPKW